MRRRDLLFGGTGLSAAVVAHPAAAQATGRARLGWLSGGRKDMGDNSLLVLKEALKGLGWKLGETLDIEERQAEGDASRLPPLAAELVALRPDAIACTGGTEAKALQAATGRIPVVFMQVPVDPV